ncbi:MAG: Fic family protein [Thermoplasmatota archaeon]
MFQGFAHHINVQVAKAEAYMIPSKRQGVKANTTAGFEPRFVLSPRDRDQAERILRVDGQIVHANVHADFMEKLRRRAASLNTHATTSIEGNPLSRADVEALAEQRVPAKKPDHREIQLHLRYYEGLIRSPRADPLTVDEIRDTHAQLLTGVLPSGVGEWKSRQNVIIDENGREIFYPTPPARVVAELEALSRWFESSPLPTPVRVSIWAHEFECIHPFRDGNGRVGRALTHRLLLSNGLAGTLYVALDAQFLADRRAYMDAIAAVQTPEWDHAPWVRYFLRCLDDAHQESLEMLEGFRAGLAGFSGLRRALLEWVLRRGGGSFTRSEFLASKEGRGYHKVSVSNTLTELAGANYLTPIGQRRSRRYVPGPRFRELIPNPEPKAPTLAISEEDANPTVPPKETRRGTQETTRPAPKRGSGGKTRCGASCRRAQSDDSKCGCECDGKNHGAAR